MSSLLWVQKNEVSLAWLSGTSLPYVLDELHLARGFPLHVSAKSLEEKILQLPHMCFLFF